MEENTKECYNREIEREVSKRSNVLSVNRGQYPDMKETLMQREKEDMKREREILKKEKQIAENRYCEWKEGRKGGSCRMTK